MPKTKSKMTDTTVETFGQRLARLRVAAGYTQQDLAAEVGSTQRMMAHYEKHATHPPAHLLTRLAKALGVSLDALLGAGEAKQLRGVKDNRLWRRFAKIEKMGAREKRQIILILDAFIEREQLKEKRAAA